MARNNLELSTWGDGTIRLSLWDSLSGADRIFILGEDGHVWREYDDETRDKVDLVAELRALAREWETSDGR